MEVAYEATLKVVVGSKLINPQKVSEFEEFMSAVEHSFYEGNEEKYLSLFTLNNNTVSTVFEVDISSVYTDDSPELLGEMSTDEKYDMRDEIEEKIKDKLKVRTDGFWITVTDVTITELT
jgi:hypothetical protein